MATIGGCVERCKMGKFTVVGELLMVAGVPEVVAGMTLVRV